jgi:hypothetical protein
MFIAEGIGYQRSLEDIIVDFGKPFPVCPGE